MPSSPTIAATVTKIFAVLLINALETPSAEYYRGLVRGPIPVDIPVDRKGSENISRRPSPLNPSEDEGNPQQQTEVITNMGLGQRTNEPRGPVLESLKSFVE
jgi:hypothetical protein